MTRKDSTQFIQHNSTYIFHTVLTITHAASFTT